MTIWPTPSPQMMVLGRFEQTPP